MPDNPAPRRWFQFRLTTWFVLVAILAWAMTEWPWVVTAQTIAEEQRTLNQALKPPALALAAFVGWKTAWMIAGRRDNPPAPH